MNRILRLIIFLLFACSPILAQTVISNVFVQSSTASTATIVWTTSTAATSQIKYGFSSTSIPYANSTDFSLVTSHSMTLPLLNASQPYYFQVVSTDNSGIPAQSSVVEFALCGTSTVPVSGTVNFAYANGSYTMTFVPPSGSSGPYTVCGQSFSQTVTGSLNTSGSFIATAADSMKVTPGPGTWTVAVNGAGSIGGISISAPLSAQTQDLSAQLQSAAIPVGLTDVTATATTCNPAWVCAGSGSVINLGSNYLFPIYSLATGKVIGPSNIGSDVSGNNLFFPAGGTVTIPGCAGKVVAADGTGCVSTGGNPGGANLQVQFNDASTFGGAIGVKTDPTHTQIQSSASVSAVTPRVDIRHPSYGATCDGVTDDSTAVQSAINAAMATTGSGVVYIPNGCYLASASNLTNPQAGSQLTFVLQGTLKLGSTFVMPRGAAMICEGRGTNPQFATGTATCNVTAPAVHGTLGTDIVSTNTSVTITPTFVAGTLAANMPVNSAITMASLMTCGSANAVRAALSNTALTQIGVTSNTLTVTDVNTFAVGEHVTFSSVVTNTWLNGQTLTILTRTGSQFTATVSHADVTLAADTGTIVGTYPADGPANVTATFSGACRIPPAAKITVSGCSDTSLNGTFFSASSDFGANTLTWRMPGLVATVSDNSCSITGLNVDSFETERIESVNVGAGTVTLRTTHTHTASDLWGMVGISTVQADLKYKVLQGISVTSNYGAGFWGDGAFGITFNGSSFSGIQYLTSIPMELSSTWGWTFEHSQTTSFSYYTCPQAGGISCGDIGPPFDMLLDLLPQSLFGQNAIPGGYIGTNSTVSIGIYETCGPTNCNITGPVLENSVIEQPMWNGITIDSRTTASIYQTSIRDSLIQDNHNQSTAAWIGMTDPGAYRKGTVAFYNATNLSYGPATTPISSPFLSVNKYYCGNVSINSASQFNSFVWPSCAEATVTFNDGNAFIGELNTPPVGLTTVPYATKPVNQTASSWTCTGAGCSITAGQLDPFGGTNAACITASTSNFANSVVYTYTAAVTVPGDVLNYGVWTRSTNNLGGTSTGSMGLSTFGSDTFDVTTNSGYVPLTQNLGWHVISGMSIVKTGATSHTITFQVTPSSRVTGATVCFAFPYVQHILASDNIPMDEIQRWRMTMMHGYVPPSLPGGMIKVLAPADKLYWGNDTNLYRSALSATITQVGFLANVGTIMATNSFRAGQVIALSGLTTNTDLNGISVTVATASPTQFTFSKTHSNVTLAADTGTALANGGIVKSDGDVDARAFLLGGSYGTSGQTILSDANGQHWGTPPGLSDPGSNGIVTRTAPNTTGLATYADIIARFGGGSCVGFPKSDGTCVNGTFSSVTLPEWTSGGVQTTGAALSANATQIWSFTPVQNVAATTKITYTPSTADNTGNLYDIGVYDSTGATLLCHAGATAGTTFAPNTNPVTLTWASSCSLTLTGGTRYILAITAVTATAVIRTGGNTMLAINRGLLGGTTSGGVLNSSITVPADSWTALNGFPQISLHN